MAKLRFILGLFISALFLFLALRNTNFQLVFDSFRRFDLYFLALCVFCQFASLLCRSYLWTHILSFEKQVSRRHAFEALIIGYMGNNVLPFRMGEAMRAYAVGMKEGMSRTLAFASIILERLIDLFVLLLFFVVLVLMMTLEQWLITSAVVVFLFLILAVAGLCAMTRDFLGLPSLLYRKAIQWLPESLLETFERVSGSFARGIKLIRNLRQALRLVFLSLAAWILWTAILYFGLKGLHLDLPVTATILLTVVVHIGVMVPSSPGFIGVFQYLCILSLSFFSVPKEVALSFSLIVHMIQYIPTTLLGWVFLTQMHVGSYRGLKQELEKADVS